jgi:hypothetical protein
MCPRVGPEVHGDVIAGREVATKVWGGFVVVGVDIGSQEQTVRAERSRMVALGLYR